MKLKRRVGRQRQYGQRYKCGRLKTVQSKPMTREAVVDNPLLLLYKLNIISETQYQVGVKFSELRHYIFGKTSASTMSFAYDHMLVRGKAKQAFFAKDIHDSLSHEYFEKLYVQYQQVIQALHDCGKVVQYAVMDVSLYDKYPSWLLDYFNGKQEFCDETHLINLQLGFGVIEKYFGKSYLETHSLLR